MSRSRSRRCDPCRLAGTPFSISDAGERRNVWPWLVCRGVPIRELTTYEGRAWAAGNIPLLAGLVMGTRPVAEAMYGWERGVY